MAHISEDRVLETATANTTVSFTTAGAVVGFRTFASQLTVGDTCYYTAQQVDVNGTPTGAWENGLGTYSAANTLTRTTVLESSNAGAAVTFGAGTIQLAIGLLAMRNVHYDNNLAVLLQTTNAEPPTPPAGNLYLYGREILPGRTVLKVKRPSGVDTPIQDAIAFNKIQKWQAAGGNLTTMFVTGFVSSGTVSAAAISSTTALSSTPTVTYQSAATAGSFASNYISTLQSMFGFRGAVNGHGGFCLTIRFALSILQAGNRGFFGLVDVITAPVNVDPTTINSPGGIGLAFNANTGNWKLVNNVTGTARTSLDLGANFPINNTDLIELVLFSRPHNGVSADNINYRVRRYTTNSDSPAFETTGTISANIPAATTLLQPSLWMTNNATAAAVSFKINSLTLESDW